VERIDSNPLMRLAAFRSRWVLSLTERSELYRGAERIDRGVAVAVDVVGAARRCVQAVGVVFVVVAVTAEDVGDVGRAEAKIGVLAEDFPVVLCVDSDRKRRAVAEDEAIEDRDVVVGCPYAGHADAEADRAGELVVEHEAAGVGRAAAAGDDGEVGIRGEDTLAVGDEVRVLGLGDIAAGTIGCSGAREGDIEEAFEIGKIAGGFDLGFGERHVRLQRADALRDEGDIDAGGFLGRVDGAAFVTEAGLNGEISGIGRQKVVGVEEIPELQSVEDVGSPGEAGVLAFDLVGSDGVEDPVFKKVALARDLFGLP
jgi:hypothetical protein